MNPTSSPIDELLHGDVFRAIPIGESVESRIVEAVRTPGPPPHRLIFGGFHGDEPKGVDLARRLWEYVEQGDGATPQRGLVVVPLVNPDGYERRNRRNARGVDLNRNFPTADWAPGPKRRRYYGGESAASEPETRMVINLIQRLKPAEIITIHSISKQQFCNNYNGPPAAKDLAQLLSACNGYPVTGHIGYPTPGSFGTWAGVEQAIPTITLELPSHCSGRRCWEQNREALLAGISAGAGRTS
ncbi:MAG: murein peptide amidase A [bacterium]|nr:murein peptide amidase A [bacterium]